MWKSIIEIEFNTGYEAKELEESILLEFKDARNKTVNVLNSGGNTEIFNYDVLGLDYNGNIH